MIHNKIGGEFEIDPELFIPKGGGFETKGFLFSSGRIALHVILDFLKYRRNINEIMLPDYLCESIIGTSENVNFKISFYKINQNFELDRASFPNNLKNKAILIINYFGLIDNHDTIIFLKKNTENCSIILDEVQALSEVFKKNEADFTFASFRKFLPVPDGGWLVSNDEQFVFEKPVNQSLYYKNKLAGGILKYYSNFVQFEDGTYLKHFEVGEDELDNYKCISAISDISMTILSNPKLGFENSFRQRNINATFIIEGLKHLEISTLFPINKLFAPLAIPIFLKNRDLIRKKFFENEIYLPIHWPVPLKYREHLLAGQKVAKIELSLIVDQRYTPVRLQRILDVLLQCKNKNLL